MPYPLRDLTGLDEAIRLKSEFLRDIATSAPDAWADLVLRFMARLDASWLQDTTALVVLLADIRAEMHLLLGADAGMARGDARLRLEGWNSGSRAEILAAFRDEFVGAAQAMGQRADIRSPLVRAAARFIDEHFAEPVTLDLLASVLKRSKRHVALLFRRDTGSTVRAYLTSVRMRHALALVRGGEKIEVVSLMVGYKSKKNFYRHFKEVIGVTPLVYKASLPSVRFGGEAAE